LPKGWIREAQMEAVKAVETAKVADEENTLRKAAWCLYACEAGGQRTITGTG
jgi:hypothetical protein